MGRRGEHGDLGSEVLEMLAEMGRSIDERLGEAGIAWLVVIVSWIIPFLAQILIVLLVAYAYYRRKGTPPPPPGRGYPLVAVIGLFLVIIGSMWLVADLVRVSIPWQINMIVLGAILLALGLTARREVNRA